MTFDASSDLSIVSGPPLKDEPGLGTLTLPGFLRDVTSQYGEREALVFRTDDGDIRWTYAELWEKAMEVACALRAHGVGKNTRVGVMMTNRPEWLSTFFGITLTGGVAVALSTFSTPSELEYLMAASNIAILLFEQHVLRTDFASVLADLAPEIDTAPPGALQSAKFPFLRYLAAVGDQLPPGIHNWDAFVAEGKDQPRDLVRATAEAVLPSDTGVLFFSSGSTSKPKGVLGAHRGVAIQMWRFCRLCGFGPDDDVRCWSANGYFWSGNFVMSLGATLAAGGCLVLQPTFSAVEALELMEAERVNYPFAWPHQWAHMQAAPNWRTADLSAIRFADVTTPIVEHPTVSVARHQPDHAYGNTETFTFSTIFEHDTPHEMCAGSRGVALPGVTVKIVDPETRDVLPRGQTGEICVKGPTLMLGYIGIPLDETLDAQGFLPTGDSGFIDGADRLYWDGRLSDIIKTGGANVSPLEVDEALATHTGVKLSKTVGVPHATLGEVVVACVVPHEGECVDTEEIRAYLRARLASYKVPRHVLVVSDDDITTTGSDKIKSGDLRKLAARRLAG